MRSSYIITSTFRKQCCRFFHYEHRQRLWEKYTHRFPVIRVGITTTFSTFIAYDGVVNEFTYCGACIRFTRSLKTASLIAIDYLLLNKNSADYDIKLKNVHQRSADRLLQTCMDNGGLYIKVGQGFAAINHILPKEYTTTLARLQDQCLPTSVYDVRKVFLQDFGQLPEEIYTEFEYKPIAAASLAQVFRAKLKNGETVAVKDIIELFFKNYNFGWILHDVRKNLIHELNFEHEGENAERCAKHMQKFSFVHVPKVYWDYTKKRVLTLQWMDGFKISNVEEIKKNNLQLKDIDVKLFTVFAEQIFRTGFVHADPHPGNIYVCANPKTGKADLILLDHGLYEELPKQIRQPLCEFWEATVLCDEQKMKSAALQIGINDYMKFAEVLFQQPLRIHGGSINNKLTEADIKYMQHVAKQNFQLVMATLKKMPRNMLFVVRNLNTIRAIGRQHGDIVDRPRVMARLAQRCIYQNVDRSLFKFIHWLCRRFVFEFCLWRTTLKINFINLYWNLLYLLGRVPASAKTLLQDFAIQEIS